MKALIVDDDLVLADVIAFTLRRAGFQALLAHDGEAALERWRSDTPDIIILDIELPKMDGVTVCRRIRASSAIPIIMLTVRDTDEDIINGLQLGADDYITKPFSPAQLVARVSAVLRRAGTPALPERRAAGGLTLHPDRLTASAPAQPPLTLTQLEFRLLESLLPYEGQVIPAAKLIERVWGPDGGDRAMLKQLVYRVRRKLDTLPGHSVRIETVPGVGYALVTQPGGDPV